MPSFGFSGLRNSSTTTLSQVNGSGYGDGLPGTMEGWRAVLTVVLRYGMAEKQRIEYNFLFPREEGEGDEDARERMEVDNVKAMVHGVKTRGVGPIHLICEIVTNDALSVREGNYLSM